MNRFDSENLQSVLPLDWIGVRTQPLEQVTFWPIWEQPAHSHWQAVHSMVEFEGRLRESLNIGIAFLHSQVAPLATANTPNINSIAAAIVKKIAIPVSIPRQHILQFPKIIIKYKVSLV